MKAMRADSASWDKIAKKLGIDFGVVQRKAKSLGLPMRISRTQPISAELEAQLVEMADMGLPHYTARMLLGLNPGQLLYHSTRLGLKWPAGPRSSPSTLPSHLRSPSNATNQLDHSHGTAADRTEELR